MSETMSDAKRNLLIGGMLILAVPFLAGLLRKNYVVLPREVWVGLVVLAGLGVLVGFYVMTRGSTERDR